MKPLQFYAVTKSGSVYRINAVPEAGDLPEVRKIYIRTGQDSKVASGEPLSDEPGNKFFITQGDGLLFAHISPNRPRELPNINYYRANSSPIVALFMTEGGATRCAESEDLEGWDERWADSSTAVLEAIGPEYPSIVLGPRLPYGPRLSPV